MTSPIGLRILCSIACFAIVLAGCGGSGSVNTLPVARASSSPAAFTGTVQQRGTIALPAGSTLNVTQLTVKNSLGYTAPASDGSFTVSQFSGGQQFAFVTNPAGDAILAGFVGAANATIDVTSTAQVYLYWAAGLFTLPAPYRAQTVAALMTQPGFGAVRDAMSNSLTANPDPFSTAMGRLAVVSALQTFTRNLYSGTNPLGAKIKALSGNRATAVAVSPATAVSGITVVNDTAGVHFVNQFRRSAQAFFDEASYVNAQGVRVTKAVTDAAPTQFIQPVANATNVTGGPINVALGLLGGSTPYDPVITPSTTLAGESGAASTRYNVTVVGAGKTNPNVTMTAAQAAAQKLVSLEQLGQDYLVPLVASITIPIDSTQIDTYLNSPQSGGALAQIAAAVDQLAPQIYPVLNGGDVSGALNLAMNAVSGNPPVQTQLLTLAGNLVSAVGGQAAAQAFQEGFSPLYGLNVLSTFLLSSDTALASANIAASNSADVFVVDIAGATPTASPSPGPTATASSSATATPVPLPTTLSSCPWGGTFSGPLTDGRFTPPLVTTFTEVVTCAGSVVTINWTDPSYGSGSYSGTGSGYVLTLAGGTVINTYGADYNSVVSVESNSSQRTVMTRIAP